MSYLRLLWSNMRSPVIAAILLVIVSTVGFVVFTDLDWFDALYMTFITVGTVGFGEVGSLGHDGRVWTMIVIVAGYAVLVSMTARFTAMILSGTFREYRDQQRRSKMLSHLMGHVIVVGFGRVGRATVEATVARGIPCAVIETDMTRSAAIEDAGAVPVIGDSRDTDVLEIAHIEQASALVTTLTDPENLVVVSSARIMRPDLRIVARVADADWSARLRRAGANDLVPIYLTAGQHLALAATTRGVRGVMVEGDGVTTEELTVQPDSPLVGLTPDQVMERHPDVVVLGIRRDRAVTRWHEVKDTIRADDVMILVGPLPAISEIANATSPRPTTD
jgi:voltage-gated potassium channel